MAKPLIVGINGSPRKNGNTAKRLREVLKSVERYGGTTKTVHLADKNIKPCLGHYSAKPSLCRYPCRIKDGMQKIYPLLMRADGIVFASPVYWFNVSGLMKNFLDRLTCLEADGNPAYKDTFYLEGKAAGFVVCGEESGEISALSAMVNFALHNGMLVPPYSAIYVFSNRKKNLEWNEKDLNLLGKNMLVMIKAQEHLEKNCPRGWPKPWDYRCKP